MLVSGIWHGAGVNFIVWGLLHGIMLAVHRWWRGIRADAVPTQTGRIAAGVLTFVCVKFGMGFLLYGREDSSVLLEASICGVRLDET